MDPVKGVVDAWLALFIIIVPGWRTATVRKTIRACSAETPIVWVPVDNG